MRLFGMKDGEEASRDARRYERIRMVLSVMCRREGQEAVNVFTDNVSVTGIKFISQKALSEGDTATLHILLHPIGETLRARGRVVWIKALGKQQFEGGLEITEMETGARMRWADFISQNRAEIPMTPGL
jgi:hypothetical protein